MKLPKIIKTVQMIVGVDLLGSKLTLTNRRAELEALTITPQGVLAFSKGTDRYVLIPYTNIKGIEFYPDPLK